MDYSWTCAHCGEVIGVYEPMIVLDESGERRTSRLTEPPGHFETGVRYHEACRAATRGPRLEGIAPVRQH